MRTDSHTQAMIVAGIREAGYKGEVATVAYYNVAALEREEAENIWRKVMEEAERGILLAALELYQGNQSLMARKLGINRTTIRTKLARHGLL